MTPIPVVGYLRCSTDKQETSVEDQRKSIQDWALAENREVVDWFIDDGISGTTAEKRPGFMAMIKQVESGQTRFREIVCYSLNRFGRFRDRSDYFYFFGLLGRAHIQVRLVTNPSANLTDLSGNLHLLIDSETSTKFSKDQSEVVLRGSITNAKRGFSSGGFAPFGYRRMLVDENGVDLGPLPDGQTKMSKTHRIRWAPDSETRVATVQRIFEMYALEGAGLKQIAQVLNRDHAPTPDKSRWQPATIRSILTNPVYVGVRRYCRTARGHFQTERWRIREEEQWVICEDAHEPIVDRGLFDMVQGMIAAQRARFKGQAAAGTMRSGNYLLTSLLFCKGCGSRLHGRTSRNGTGKVYRVYDEAPSNKGIPSRCSAFRIDSEGLEDAVLTMLADTLNPGLSEKRILARIRKEIVVQTSGQGDVDRESEKVIAGIDTKIQRIKQAILAGVAPETFVVELDELNQMKAEHQSQKKEPLRRPVSHEEIERLAQESLAFLSNLRRALGQMDRLALKQTLQDMVDKIEIDKAGKRGFVYLADLAAVADPLTNVSEIKSASSGFRPPAFARNLLAISLLRIGPIGLVGPILFHPRKNLQPHRNSTEKLDVHVSYG